MFADLSKLAPYSTCTNSACDSAELLWRNGTKFTFKSTPISLTDDLSSNRCVGLNLDPSTPENSEIEDIQCVDDVGKPKTLCMAHCQPSKLIVFSTHAMR